MLGYPRAWKGMHAAFSSRRAAAALAPRALSTVAPKPLRLQPQLESVLSRFRATTGPKGQKEEASARLVEDFQGLQSRSVMRVLLVCSDYDSYTFEEDGLLTELIDAEYSEACPAPRTLIVGLARPARVCPCACRRARAPLSCAPCRCAEQPAQTAHD